MASDGRSLRWFAMAVVGQIRALRTRKSPHSANCAGSRADEAPLSPTGLSLSTGLSRPHFVFEGRLLLVIYLRYLKLKMMVCGS